MEWRCRESKAEWQVEVAEQGRKAASWAVARIRLGSLIQCLWVCLCVGVPFKLLMCCTYTHTHTLALWWTLLCSCLTQVRKMFYGCRSASTVTLQMISLLHSNQAGGSGGKKPEKGMANIVVVWVCTFCLQLCGNMLFIAFCLFPYLPLYSLLSFRSLCLCGFTAWTCTLVCMCRAKLRWTEHEGEALFTQTNL